MYRNTRFGELLKVFPRGAFDRQVNALNADKYAKGFRCWDQFVALLYAQLSGSGSLRELEASFNAQTVCHYHLGTRPIRRSTLSDANANKSPELYANLCQQLLQGAHRQVRQETRELLYVLDSTPIPLKGKGYDNWTLANSTGHTQGLKAHFNWEHGSGLPVQLEVTAPNINDIDVGREVGIEKGAVYVFDKRYCDYNWWYQLHKGEACFVTRVKKNAALDEEKALFRASDSNAASAKDGEILEDSLVRFRHRSPGGGRNNDYYGKTLRRVVVKRADKATPLVLISNDLTRKATEIAAIYRQRWGIELFFKWLKQNLKIKRFLGRSENAVKTQLYIAVIAYLLVARLRQCEAGARADSLRHYLIELRATLFQRDWSKREHAREKRQRRRLLEQQQMAFNFS